MSKNRSIAMSATRSNAERDTVSRRDFLALLTKATLALSGMAGLAGLARFFDAPAEKPPPKEFDLGPSENYPPGSRTPVPEAGAVLIHDSQGFSAVSTVCPHLGCQVNLKETGFACPCHGSQFDEEGRLVRGPAQKGLQALRLEVTENNRLILHTD